MILPIIVLAGIILVIIAINDSQDSDKALTVAEPTLEETLWDDMVEWTEEMFVIKDRLQDLCEHVENLNFLAVTSDEFTRLEAMGLELVADYFKILERIEKYNAILYLNPIIFEVRESIVVKQTNRRPPVKDIRITDFKTLSALFNLQYITTFAKVITLMEQMRRLGFVVISKIYFQEAPQVFLKDWVETWEEVVNAIFTCEFNIVFNPMGSLIVKQTANHHMKAVGGLTVWLEGQESKAISLQILEDWFRLDGLAPLRVTSGLETEIVDLKDAIDGASVVMFDDIDELLAASSDEQKEDLFDLLKSRREQGTAIMIFASSTSAESLSVYDFDRLGLHEAETLNLL